jgi:hypothetical protein
VRRVRETRRKVLERLSVRPATVSELAAPFDMQLPSFVLLLSVLEQSRLVKSKKQGRVRTIAHGSLEHGSSDITRRPSQRRGDLGGESHRLGDGRCFSRVSRSLRLSPSTKGMT